MRNPRFSANLHYFPTRRSSYATGEKQEAELKASLEDKEAELAAARTTTTTSEQKQAELKATLAEKETELAAARTTTANVEKEKDLVCAEKTIAKLTSEVEEASTQVERLTEIVAEKQAEVDKLEAEVAFREQRQNEEIADLQARVIDGDDRLGMTNETIGRLEDEVKARRCRAKELEARNANLQALMDEQDEQLAEMKAAVGHLDEIQGAKTKLEADLAAALEKIRQNEANATLKAERNRSQTELAAFETKVLSDISTNVPVETNTPRIKYALRSRRKTTKSQAA